MKTLLILCAGGCTSSLMAQKMERYATQKGLKVKVGYIADYKGKTEFREMNKDVDVFLGYGPANIQKADLNGWEDVINGVLISPQVKCYQRSIKEVLDPLNIPCDLINSIQFGRMQADLVFEQGLKLIGLTQAAMS